MTSKKITLLIVILFSFVSCKVGHQNIATISNRGIDDFGFKTVADITEKDIRFHLGVLASDAMQGRESGSPDEALAAEYIKKRFTALGLKAFDNNYIQDFPVILNRYFNNCELNFDGYSANYPSDFKSMIMFDSLTISGGVVFARYGEDSDYENIDVKNKWVLILEHENGILFEKKSIAKSKGASGLLAVGADGTSGNERYVLPSDSISLIRISHNLANRMLASAGTNVQEISEKAKLNDNQNINIPINITATIKSAKRSKPSQNVIAYLEASNSNQKNEYIVIGAHYDHIGIQTVNGEIQINNGADDNASGVAGMLEIAEKLISLKNFNYNVIFVAFGAEELGLVGSNYFCSNPPVSLEKIKLMFNLDMIGRMNSSNSVYINTIEKNDNLIAVVDTVKKSHPKINISFLYDYYLRGSDHAPFFKNKIPVISFTTGLHNDYHKPGDIIDLINFGGQKLLLDFVYDVVISPDMDECIRSFTSSEVKT